jgi:hypothetical protein
MNQIECGLYYCNTGKVPPVNLNTWVSVYNIIVNAGFGKIGEYNMNSFLQKHVESIVSGEFFNCEFDMTMPVGELLSQDDDFNVAEDVNEAFIEGYLDIFLCEGYLDNEEHLFQFKGDVEQFSNETIKIFKDEIIKSFVNFIS